METLAGLGSNPGPRRDGVVLPKAAPWAGTAGAGGVVEMIWWHVDKQFRVFVRKRENSIKRSDLGI